MKYERTTFFLHQEAELHRNLLLFLITLVTIITSSFLISGLISSGSSRAAGQDRSYKYYTSLEIQEGDTLWEIASEHITEEYASVTEYVNEIKVLNHLGDDSIHAGQYLTIPYYSDTFR